METNIILAGVGGQGILTIAQVISTAAIGRGLTVKQAEVHGMAQRGGAVYSHLRIADHPIHSDLIPNGECDLIIAMEPLESLRYVGSLREEGQILTSTTPLVNMSDYPAVEELLERICACSKNVLIDAERLARTAGSVLAGNSALLGAASTLLDFETNELEGALCDILKRKGDRVVEANRRAFRLGRSTATAYTECLRRGARPAAARRWLAEIPPERLLDGDLPALSLLTNIVDRAALCDAERMTIADILQTAANEHRAWLFEHEVYSIVDLAGAITPPRHRFVACGEILPAEELYQFAGDQVVLKIVSRSIVHKSDVGGVVFVPKKADLVNRRMGELIERQQDRADGRVRRAHGTGVRPGVVRRDSVLPSVRSDHRGGTWRGGHGVPGAPHEARNSCGAGDRREHHAGRIFGTLQSHSSLRCSCGPRSRTSPHSFRWRSSAVLSCVYGHCQRFMHAGGRQAIDSRAGGEPLYLLA
jgi:indolepyruvate ferredoxin oxidoreductase, beta subunit